MSIDIEKLTSLTADEIQIAIGLNEVAKEAEKHANIILKAYRCFGIGENRIEVWHDEIDNSEYLTHNGIWEGKHLGQLFKVKVSKNDIFKIYASKWLINNGYIKPSDDFFAEHADRKLTASYFRDFVSRIENS